MVVSFMAQQTNIVSIYIIYDLVKGNISESFISSHEGKDDFIKGSRRKDTHKIKSPFYIMNQLFLLPTCCLVAQRSQSPIISAIYLERQLYFVRVCIFILTFYSTSALPMLNVKRIRLLSFEVFYLSHVRSFLFE